MNDALNAFLYFLVLAALIFGMGVGGYLIGKKELRQEAVKSGHAEYYLDEKNERQWRWK